MARVLNGTRRSIAAAALLGVMALLYYLMFLFTPIQVDDLMFAQEYMAANHGSADFSFHGFWSYFRFIRDQINGRIPNMVCAFWVLHLHHGVGSMLLAMTTVWMFMAINRLNMGRISTFGLSMAWCAGAVLLPWRSGMFITDIALNYIPASLAILWLYREFTTPTHTRLWLLLPLAFITALLHEGASIIMIAACGSYALLSGLRLSSRQWTIGALFFGGTALLLTSPGIWLRFDGAQPPSITLKAVVMGIPATLLLIAAIICALTVTPWRRKIRPLLHSHKWLGCVTAAAVGALMQWRLGFAFERGAWFGELFAITALTALVAALTTDANRTIQTLLTIVAALIPGAVLCGSVIMQHRAFDEHEAVLQKLRLSPTGTAFHDLHPRSSRLLLNYPMTYTWLNPDHLLIVNNGSPQPVAVVPVELASASRTAMTPVPGNVGALRFGLSYLLPDRQLNMLDAHGLPYPDCPIELTDFTYTLADGSVHPVIKTLLQRFSLPDGTRMLLIRPLDFRLTPPFVSIDCGDDAAESPRADVNGQGADTAP